jgi:uncharacterized membrane protein YkvA (DUF1232 family)
MAAWIWVTALSLLVTWVLAILLLALLGRRLGVARLGWLLPDMIRLLRRILQDERTPRSSRWWLLFALGWCLSPIDLVPEFLPVLGAADDVVVVALVLRHVLKTAGPDLIREHWSGDPEAIDRMLRLAGRRA